MVWEKRANMIRSHFGSRGLTAFVQAGGAAKLVNNTTVMPDVLVDLTCRASNRRMKTTMQVSFAKKYVYLQNLPKILKIQIPNKGLANDASSFAQKRCFFTDVIEN